MESRRYNLSSIFNLLSSFLNMRKNVFGKRLRRDKNERTALFKNLISSFVLYGSMKTTEAKAKAIKGSIDKLVTKAKKGEDARRLIAPFVNPEALEKLLKEAKRFSKRSGGYTTTVKIGKRIADNAAMVVMKWVDWEEEVKPEVPTSRLLRRSGYEGRARLSGASKTITQKSKVTKKIVSKTKKEKKK